MWCVYPLSLPHIMITSHWQDTLSPAHHENANERHFILGNICLRKWAAHEKRIRLWEPVCSWWSISLKHTLVCLFSCVCVAPCLWIIKPTSHCNCQQLADWLLSAAICMMIVKIRKWSYESKLDNILSLDFFPFMMSCVSKPGRWHYLCGRWLAFLTCCE